VAGKNRDVFEKKGLYFVPLGGSEEFGANLNAYRCDDDFLVVDCGVAFADERYPGIDLLLPDTKFLEGYKDQLKGLIVTHAHEDHIGAVGYLWDKLECPIYCTAFTAAILRGKLEENGVRGVPITVVKQGERVKIGAFDIEFEPVSHSVPQSSSLFIRTSYGNVLHSGDWNLDPHPVVGKPTDGKAFKAFGDEEVLAYVGDSTNAQVQGRSGSEKEVAIGMAAEFAKCEGKIAVTIFSSNIGRIISVAKAAQEVGRSVCVVGRSMHRMVAAAYACGYMGDVPDFVGEEDLNSIPDENVVLIVTGSQGEYRAALAKIARGDFRNIKLGKNDTVIFSSRAIPGNEKNINTVKNNLSAGGVRVVTPSDTKNIIHVSGHPCRDEIQDMLQWVRPKCVIPVHGERMQIDAHAALARDCQVEQVIIPNNGSVIKLAPQTPQIVDHVHVALLAVDQRRIIPSDHQSIVARRKLQYSGAVHASIVLDPDLRILGVPKIDTVGLSSEKSDDKFEDDLMRELHAILHEMADEFDLEEEDIAEELRIGLRRYVMDILGLKPKVTVHVTMLDL